MKTKAPKRSAAPKTPCKRTLDDPEQFKRFVEAARKADVDESGKEFDKAFDRIVESSRRSAKE